MLLFFPFLYAYSVRGPVFYSGVVVTAGGYLQG
jgi:hypothetical protein